LVKVNEVHKVWKIRNKKIIHKPTNQGQSMKHNRTCVTLQEMLNEIKLIDKEIEISRIDRTISTHGDTNALSINIHDTEVLADNKMEELFGIYGENELQINKLRNGVCINTYLYVTHCCKIETQSVLHFLRTSAYSSEISEVIPILHK
jgi:hypothetical protein